MKTLSDRARKLDREDPLGKFRNEFHIPLNDDGSEQQYFCGHSLGLQPKSAGAAVQKELDTWRELAVHGHFQGDSPWMNLNEKLCHPLADLAGALPAEVVVMNTLTVNLHLLMVSFFRPQGTRRKILLERHAFPSDRYAVESQLRFHGLDPADCLVELAPGADGQLFEESDIETYLSEHGEEIALVLWPGVQYISGQAFDLARLTAAAHRAGAMIGFDLAHAIGNVPLALHDSDCDFTAWCHYKYLNSGPGAIGGCFVHERHHRPGDLPRFNGWWGNDPESRFRMEHRFAPACGAAAWQLSTPPILSMAPLQASLAIFQAAGPEQLRHKSRRLSAYLAEGIQSRLDEVLEILTPPEPDRRGCQLSLRVRSGREDGQKLFQYLAQRGVITDWREPDVIRVAPVPLYNSFADCHALIQNIGEWCSPHIEPGLRD
jgi:kynureninase